MTRYVFTVSIDGSVPMTGQCIAEDVTTERVQEIASEEFGVPQDHVEVLQLEEEE